MILKVNEYAFNLSGAAEEIFYQKRIEIKEKSSELGKIFLQLMERYKFMLSRTAERMHNGLGRIFTGFKMLEQ